MTTNTDAPNVDQILNDTWPLRGPYNADRTISAAGAMSDLTRYLNYATQHGEALPYPATVYDIVGRLAAMASRLDQTFDQLNAYLLRLRDAAGLYDCGHRNDPAAAARRAEEALAWLVDAQEAAGLLSSRLQQAHSSLGRLGIHDGGDGDQ